MPNIDTEQLYRRDSQLVSTIMDGNMVMMDVEHGAYYGLCGVGTRIWELLEGPVSAQQIIQTLCSEFEVDETTCKADVEKFIGEMEEKGMVSKAGQPT
jgi:hypothetical protein